MKIGLSLSRCMRDILEEKVDIEDVLVIVARTDVDPNNDDHWRSLWDGYIYGGLSNPEWTGLEEYEQAMRDILISLYEEGKLHQPRQYGAHPRRLPYYWLDTFAPEEEIATNPSVQKAWDNYKLLAGLSA